jgi:hypothetical protein
MNTQEEIKQAFQDFEDWKMWIFPN